MGYKVEFEFMNSLGEWKKGDMSFYGTMTKEEAEYWCRDFRSRENHRNVKVVKYKTVV